MSEHSPVGLTHPSVFQFSKSFNGNRFPQRYLCFAAESASPLAKRLAEVDPDRFKYLPIKWDKFPDGTDNIIISGFHPRNEIAGEHILFFASFHNNDVTLSQFTVLIVLLQSFIESLTIVLPFYPVGTNERVVVEGHVATANTYSILLSSLPSIGRPNRLMIYDIHALQNRFYFHGSTIPSLHTAIPIVLQKLRQPPYNTIQGIVFPDEGAAKRFHHFFKSLGHFEKIVCGKVRDGQKRHVVVQDGDCTGKECIIIDDLVQTGGTLYECAVALKAKGATKVFAFVTHAVFPQHAWKQFSKTLQGQKAIFDGFWVTNSVPSVTSHLPPDDVFEVLDLLPQIMEDLDMNTFAIA